MRLGGIWKAGLGSPKPDPEVSARIKHWTRTALGLDDNATISINEIICADPACPGSETVILVMVPGQRTKAYKVQAAMAEVGEEMVGVALA
ncbi:MAG: hypothetical protein ACRCUE_03420 [Bosea sp. (in: a-proteobacteria)]